MKRLLIVAFISFILVQFGSAQTEKDEMLKKNGEIYFSFQVSDHKEISALTKIISIDNVKGNTVFAYANAREIKAFEETGIPYKLLPHPNEGFQPLMKGIKELGSKTVWNFYPTYDAYVSLMYQFETNYPAICDVYSIGQTVQGRELLVAKISDNVGTDEAEPEFLYTSSMHGNETTGYIFMMHLIDSLVTNYGSVPRITNLVNNIEIYINPLANPDGTYHGGNNSVSGATRYNANSVDLNRNYPDPQDGPHPDGNAWQPETVAFMNFAESRHFVMSANFHGGTEVCNYPWDTWATLHPDDQWWQYVCHEYADTAQTYSVSGYMNGYNDGITNGFAWYEVDGGRQDYMNYYHQCREQTIEVSDAYILPAASHLAFWGYNRRSLLNYLEQCTFGIRGMITDANTGLPVEAEVYVLNHEDDSSWVYSSPAGNYHRFLIAGTYNVRFSSPCYQTQTFNNISVTNHTATNLNVQLVPNSNAVDFTASSTSIAIGGIVSFTDQSCGNPYSWLWSITGPGTPVYTGGTTNTSQNPIVQFNTAGSYTVSLTATGPGGTFTQTKTNYITVTSCTVCTSGSNNGTEEWISNVTFNTINNSSAVGSGYTNYTAISTTVTKGSAYTLSATCGSTGTWTEHIWAFIDMNQDCDFIDANESYDLGQTSGPGTKTISITIPAGATTGSTRMRVSLKYNSDPSSCETFSYGEVEDYTLIIQAAGSPPVANFAANNITPFIGQTVIFTDQSTNTPTSWSWSFSPSTVTYTGGTNSSSQNPQVQFNAGGPYNVTLNATNAFGSDSEIKTGYISVIYAPVAEFTADNTTPVTNMSVYFMDLSTNNPTSWSWSFTPPSVVYVEGTSSTSQEPVVQFTAGGSYNVSLTAANGSGSDNETKTGFILVTAVPVAEFISSNTAPVEGETVTFTDLSTNIPVSWAWSFTPATVTYLAGTNSASQNPQVQFNAPGNYSVQLTSGNAAGFDTEIKMDYITVQSLDFYLDLKVMIEGAFNGSNMNTDLTGFPLSQPYSGSPWTYPGTENVASIPAGVVDWILIELRDAGDAASANSVTRIGMQAGFLLNDGSIVSIDGITLPLFNDLTIQQSLFVVIWHRNHLPILSANPLIKTGNIYSCDFTTMAGQAYGIDAQKFLADGIYGLFGGDANADGIIDDADKDISWQDEAGQSGYLPSDLNLDGQSGNQDKNGIWLPNTGKGSQIP